MIRRISGFDDGTNILTMCGNAFKDRDPVKHSSAVFRHILHFPQPPAGCSDSESSYHTTSPRTFHRRAAHLLPLPTSVIPLLKGVSCKRCKLAITEEVKQQRLSFESLPS